MPRLLLLLLVSCGDTGGKDTAFSLPPLPGCGDGELTADEQCDEGEDNSDVLPGACRTNCLSARCGDGVVDPDEACDDGETWGGDGCSEFCAEEVGSLESEPNDDPSTAPALSSPVVGSLRAGDRDCFQIEVADCASLSARVTDGSGACEPATELEWFDPSGDQVAVGTPGADGCTAIDPSRAAGATWLEPGVWTLCVDGLLGAVVDGYVLTWDVGVSEDLDIEVPDDLDGDGIPSRCDLDDDGDGVADAEDNCPETPNGPDAAGFAPNEEGFLVDWLTVGPLVDESSPDACLPTEDRLGDDASARPSLAESVEGEPWVVWQLRSDRLDFTRNYGDVDAPREAYAVTYVYAATERDVTLAMGLDDGARVWIDEEVVMEVSSCQGVVSDDFTEEVTLPEGWSRLMVKVYDQGGGWGFMGRFKDGDDPVLDLEVSLSPDGPWEPDQTDSDGDGLGDVCDPDPLGG